MSNIEKRLEAIERKIDLLLSNKATKTGAKESVSTLSAASSLDEKIERAKQARRKTMYSLNS